jgi:rubredoxin
MLSSDDKILYPPWTDEQIELLNGYQNCGRLHPYTCTGGFRDSDCPGDTNLVATRDGWKCPVCGRLQPWAWKDSMIMWKLRSGIDFLDKDHEERTGEKLLSLDEVKEKYKELDN